VNCNALSASFVSFIYFNYLLWQIAHFLLTQNVFPAFRLLFSLSNLHPFVSIVWQSTPIYAPLFSYFFTHSFSCISHIRGTYFFKNVASSLHIFLTLLKLGSSF